MCQGSLEGQNCDLRHPPSGFPAGDGLDHCDESTGGNCQLGTYRELVREGKDFGSLVDALQNSLHSVSEASHVKSDENPQTGPERKLSDSPSSEGLSRKESQETAKLSAPGNLKGKLIQEEKRETGRVESRLFWAYLTEFRGEFFFILILISLAFTTVFTISSDAWLGQGTLSGIGGMTGARLMVYVLFCVRSRLGCVFKQTVDSVCGRCNSSSFVLRHA